MFKAVLEILVILLACSHVLTVEKPVAGFNMPCAVSERPAVVQDPFSSYPVSNAFLHATSISQSAEGSVSQPVLPNVASTSDSESSVSEFLSAVVLSPTAVSEDSSFLQGPSSSYPVANPFLTVPRFSQSTARSSVIQSSVPNAVSASYSQSSLPGGSTPNPCVATFSKEFAQALTSSNILKKYEEFDIPGSAASNLIHDLSAEILLSEGLTDPSLADAMGQAVSYVEFLTPTLYFHVVGNTVGRFLLSKGLLKPETASTFPQMFVNAVEKAAIVRGVSDSDSFIQSISYGFVNFVNSLGFTIKDIARELTQLFVEEITRNTN